mgnify:FL=1
MRENRKRSHMADQKSDQEFRKIAFLNDLVGEETEEFIAGMNNHRCYSI